MPTQFKMTNINKLTYPSSHTQVDLKQALA